MRILKNSIIILFLAACNSPQAVYDYDQKVNFDQYSTYSLFPEFETGLSQLDESRLTTSLRSAMQLENFSVSEDPEIYVNVYTQEYQQDNRSRVGVGIGGGGGNVGVGVSGGLPVGRMNTYLKLTFDFIDVKKDMLVWQAIVESPFEFGAEPQVKQDQLDKIVAKALKGYPPKK